MYIELLVVHSDNRVSVKFHEGVLHNKVFKKVHLKLVLMLIIRQKIDLTPKQGVFKALKVFENYPDQNDQSFIKEVSEALGLRR